MVVSFFICQKLESIMMKTVVRYLNKFLLFLSCWLDLQVSDPECILVI